jgi:hypothetical protein
MTGYVAIVGLALIVCGIAFALMASRLAKATEKHEALQNEIFSAQKRLKDSERTVAAQQLTVSEFSSALVNDNLRLICQTMTAYNIESGRKKLSKVFALLKKHNIEITEVDRNTAEQQINAAHLDAVRREELRQEQARIRAEAREEEKVRAELDAEVERAKIEQEKIEAALKQALGNLAEQHSTEVEQLRRQLAEAESRTQRAISLAQLTRNGHVYVLSNIGSFGENCFKIGMTRRETPEDRVAELSSAAVPFPFDVHMMIRSTDAPALENALHKELHEKRVNKVNLRKEYFRAPIEDIVAAIEKHHGVVEYIVDPLALQYRKSTNEAESNEGADTQI